MLNTNQCLFCVEEYQCTQEPDYPYHYCLLHNTFADEKKALIKLKEVLSSKKDIHIGYLLNNLILAKTESLKIKQKKLVDFHVEGSLIDRLFLISSNLKNIVSLENTFNHLVLDDLLIEYLNINRLNSFRSNIISCDFENSFLSQCNFMEGVINDCTFIKIHFKNCVIDNFKLRNNQFIDCHFENCRLMNNTIITNHFEGCQGIEHLTFTDCLIDPQTQSSLQANLL